MSKKRTLWISVVVVAILVLLVLVIQNADPIPTSSYAEFYQYFADRIQARHQQFLRQFGSSTLVLPEDPNHDEYPTLADFWVEEAHFEVDVIDTGLPMGESETIVTKDDQLWSYVHASQRSAGVVDRCGEPVEFPGCTVIYRSLDQGVTFAHEEPPVCQIDCRQCPCDSQFDHIEQQQYPRVAFNGDLLHMVYEYKAMVMYRTSHDGLLWSRPLLIPQTGVWGEGFLPCPEHAQIRTHPHTVFGQDCLVGGPPGIYTEGGKLYVFVGMGQNPGNMGCYVGPDDGTVRQMKRCENNPLFTGVADYGPLDEYGPSTNPHFDFRTISSADVQRIGDRYYMLYEGVRGPGPGDPGDTQFGLGLARSLTDQIDGPWEMFSGNPILVDMPGNIGVGHADLLILKGQTYVYTSLDGQIRSRLVLKWR